MTALWMCDLREFRIFTGNLVLATLACHHQSPSVVPGLVQLITVTEPSSIWLPNLFLGLGGLMLAPPRCVGGGGGVEAIPCIVATSSKKQ